MDDDELREKLAKVEALFRQAGSPGERAAAGAAMDRLGDHGDEQMPVGTPLGAVEDGAQAEFGRNTASTSVKEV